MNNSPKITFLFRTIFRPTQAVYYGVHESTDFCFGTEQATDPFIGDGAKLVALARANDNERRLFNVQVIRAGTKKDCDDHLKRILADLDYSNPLTLNSKEGWQKGRAQTPEHRQNAAAARSEPLKGNQNAVGQRGPHIDIDLPGSQKLKWFHSPDNTDHKMILVDGNNKPVKEIYADWLPGRMHKNPYVQQKLSEVRAEAESKED